MATTKGKSGSTRSGQRSSSSSRTTRSRTGSTARQNSSRQSNKQPIRREVGAFVCLFLAIAVVFALFNVDAPFFTLLNNLFSGLIGAGFYVMPVSLFLCFMILLLHDGRPVRARVLYAMLFSVMIGAFIQIVSSRTNVFWSKRIFQDLWSGGIHGTAGGVLSGLLGLSFQHVLGKVFSAIIFILASLLFLLLCMNMTPFSLARAIRNRPRPAAYAEPEDEPRDTAATIVNHVAQRHIDRKEQRTARKRFEFDLPVDDQPVKTESEQKTESKSKRRQVQTVPPAEPVQETAANLFAAEPEQLSIPIPTQQEPSLPVMTPAEYLAAHQKEINAEIPSSANPAPVVMPDLPKSDETVNAVPFIEELPPLEQEKPETVRPEDAAIAAAEVAMEIQASEEAAPPVYVFPPMDLLHDINASSIDGSDEMRINAERLNATLRSFSIDAEIIDVTRGPSVTRYELHLHEGVKLSKVTGLADDIALALGASGIRISAIPDKISVVGVEVPNKLVSTVFIREVLDSPEFADHKSKTAFAIGKDIGGKRIIGNIAKLPHMLIAGTTGSGKSVCMNSIIISLLYKAKPDEVRLIMVDPKMVELGVYNGIPHLLIPVVTDPKKAAGALQWSVNEMMRRYRTMADAGVRDLESYNKLAASNEDMKPMESIVIVIDELADLMLVAAKEVEESICRVAQMGRAAGMHLIIATQRPSADVITGLMKANIPSRIAFAVASAMESRIILDTTGAEKLVGKGDMLYAPLGIGKPMRVQGCFITDDEVQAVVEHIKSSSVSNYDSGVIDEIDRNASKKDEKNPPSSGLEQTSASDSDELLPAAVDVILETGQASVSMLQRRLKLGYARAARIVDEMEELGYVGPFEGSKPRQLLITKEQWAAIQGGASISDFDPNPPVEEEIP